MKTFRMKMLSSMVCIIFAAVFAVTEAAVGEESEWQSFREGGKYGFKDAQGNVRIPAKWDKVGTVLFREGLAVVGNGRGNNQRVGFIDKTGTVVIPLKYRGALSFSEGFALVTKDGKKWGYIDQQDRAITPFKYDKSEGFHNGFGIVRVGNTKGYVDRNGNETWGDSAPVALPAIPAVAQVAATQNDDPAEWERLKKWTIFYSGGKYGVKDANGNVVIPPKYGDVKPFSEGLAAVREVTRNQGKWGFIDKTGKEVLPLIYGGAEPFNEAGWAKVKIGGTFGEWGLIDKTGKELRYTDVKPFKDGLAAVKLDGRWGLIDKTGREVVTPKYDFVGEFSEGLAAVVLVPPERRADFINTVKKVGFIDKTGKEVIPLIYDSVEGKFEDGKVQVTLNGKRKHIDREGNDYVFASAAVAAQEYDLPKDAVFATIAQEQEKIAKQFLDDGKKLFADTLQLFDAAVAKLKQSGDLDGLLEAKKIRESLENEEKQFAANESLPASKVSNANTAAVNEVLETYRLGLQKLNKESRENVLALYQKSIAECDAQVKRLTMDDKIDEAVKVRANLETLRTAHRSIQNSAGSLHFATGVQAGQRLVLKIRGIEYAFRWCPAGTFTMGGKITEDFSWTPHKVTLTKGFWIQETETTQEQWESVMGYNPSKYTGAKYPVESIGWYDCVSYACTLDRLGNAPQGYHFALPTEAQWEYACRAGTTTSFGFGDALDKNQANIKETGIGSPTAVHSYKPNSWGIYDMHGNICEWTNDWANTGRTVWEGLNKIKNYGDAAVVDPTGRGHYRSTFTHSEHAIASRAGSDVRIDVVPSRTITEDDFVIIRGGYFGNEQGDCNSAIRHKAKLDYRSGLFGGGPRKANFDPNIGMRLVLVSDRNPNDD